MLARKFTTTSIVNRDKQPFRVLHVLYELRPSGAEAMLRAAGPHFAKLGIQSDILATGPNGQGPYASVLMDAGYRVYHIPNTRSFGSIVQVARFMRKGAYDAIHLHTESANFWFGLAALASGARRILRTVHSSFQFAGWLRMKRGVQRRILHGLGLTHVAVGPTVQQTEQERFGNRTVLLENWYDNDHFRPPTPEERGAARTALGLHSDAFAVVTVGGCLPVKNHGALIEAIARLPAGKRPVYLHVGIEQPDHPERQQASDLEVSESIRFLGYVDDQRDALFAADAYVMPSLYEGMPIAAVEALAVGLPCIFTETWGLRDFRDHFPGIEYVSPDAASIRDALERLMQLGRSELSNIAATYAQTAINRYGIRRGVQGYVQLYRSQ